MSIVLESRSDRATGFRTDTENYSTGANPQSADIVIFRHLVRSLLRVPSRDKAKLRETVTHRLLKAREPFLHVYELLDLCASAGTTDRLDLAIDILSRTGVIAFNYAWQSFICDLRQWNPNSDRAYEPNDDHWYVLMRAVARCDLPADQRLRFVSVCTGASHRGILEGVVEALGDIASDESRKLLKDMADHHEDPFIRKLAGDILNDKE